MLLRKLLFSFHGRITRQTFWLSLIAVNLTSVFMLAAVSSAAMLNRASQSDAPLGGRGEENFTFFVVLALFLLCVAAGVWAGLAVQVKRWHDRDKSGWMVLINLIPIAGTLWALVETGFLKGSTGGNRYGEDPLQKETGTESWATLGGHAVLCTFPSALLFLTVSSLASMQQLLGAFRLQWSSLQDARSAVPVLVGSVLRPLWFGTMAALAVLVAAGGVQAAAAIADRRSSPMDPTRPGVGEARWGKWLLVATAVLVVSVGVLIHYLQSIGSLVMALVDPSKIELARRLTAGRDLGQTTAWIMYQIYLAALGASVLSALMVFLTALNVRIVNSWKMTRTSIARYSWALLGGTVAAAAWLAIRLGTNIHRLEDLVH